VDSELFGEKPRAFNLDDQFNQTYLFNVNNDAEIIFDVESCEATGGYVARWNEPDGGGITTQGDSFGELDRMIADAIAGYFEPDQPPKNVRLRVSTMTLTIPSDETFCNPKTNQNRFGRRVSKSPGVCGGARIP
jgi:predicted RNase H-like HicB family nuclease